jgi:ribosome biogenesis GTPase A
MAQDINWFPGHMRKALNDTKDKLKLVDLVYETCDARIPFSSRNPELSKIIGDKKRILILNKSDLADPNLTDEWIKYHKANGLPAVSLEAVDRKSIGKLTDLTMELMKETLEKASAKGRTGRPIRVMVVGVPNTGKSTLINSLAGKKAAVTGDKPGVTRQPKWIPTGGRLELMDMPGVLWPKLGSRKSQVILAATGAVKAEVTDVVEVAYDASNLLWEMYPSLMSDRYGEFEEGIDPYDRFQKMARSKGCLMSGGRIDEDRFSRLFLDDLRSGRIGRITFEKAQKD